MWKMHTYWPVHPAFPQNGELAWISCLFFCWWRIGDELTSSWSCSPRSLWTAERDDAEHMQWLPHFDNNPHCFRWIGPGAMMPTWEKQFWTVDMENITQNYGFDCNEPGPAARRKWICVFISPLTSYITLKILIRFFPASALIYKTCLAILSLSSCSVDHR